MSGDVVGQRQFIHALFGKGWHQQPARHDSARDELAIQTPAVCEREFESEGWVPRQTSNFGHFS